MSDQEQRQPLQYADAKIAGFVGPAMTRNERGALYQFTIVVQFSTGGTKNEVHSELIAYDGVIKEKSVETLSKLFPTWNKSLLYSENPVAALEDLDRVGKELGSSDGKPLSNDAYIPVRVAYVMRPWTTRSGEARTVFESKFLSIPNGRSFQRSNTPASALMAAFGKAPPPPARAPRAAAPKAAPVAFPSTADGAYAAFMANGGKEADFWSTVEARAGKTDGLTEVEWKALISWFQMDKPAPAPAAPPARAARFPGQGIVKPSDEPEDSIPF